MYITSEDAIARQPVTPAIKLFADGANLEDMLRIYAAGEADGFTTNPTLLRKAGVTDFADFARTVLARITDLPISFEVFSDDFDEMEVQARRLASWGSNVYVKIPVTNTAGHSSAPLIRRLSRDGVKVNATAIMTLQQVAQTLDALADEVPAVISIFAGRIADTGRDPVPVMSAAVAMAAYKPAAEILWASPREVFNIHQAQACGCHIITATPDILKKLSMAGMDLDRLSQDTVRMFRQDTLAAGYQL